MTSLPKPRRLLFAVAFAIVIATTPAVATFAGPGFDTAANTMAAPSGDCTINQSNGSVSLNCGPTAALGGWNPGNDWNGGLPSESGLTHQNDQRRH